MKAGLFCAGYLVFLYLFSDDWLMDAFAMGQGFIMGALGMLFYYAMRAAIDAWREDREAARRVRARRIPGPMPINCRCVIVPTIDTRSRHP